MVSGDAETKGRPRMEKTGDRRHERWANLRHAIVGALLAAPPKRGALRAELEALAA